MYSKISDIDVLLGLNPRRDLEIDECNRRVGFMNKNNELIIIDELVREKQRPITIDVAMSMNTPVREHNWVDEYSKRNMKWDDLRENLFPSADAWSEKE